MRHRALIFRAPVCLRACIWHIPPGTEVCHLKTIKPDCLKTQMPLWTKHCHKNLSVTIGIVVKIRIVIIIRIVIKIRWEKEKHQWVPPPASSSAPVMAATPDGQVNTGTTTQCIVNTGATTHSNNTGPLLPTHKIHIYTCETHTLQWNGQVNTAWNNYTFEQLHRAFQERQNHHY